MNIKPNIILFLTDDHGQWANGAYGNHEVHTPSLDYLANHGALMENAFTPTPVCSPSRACLLTGRISSQHGLHDYLGSEESDDINGYPWMGEEKLLPEILHDNGYQTGFCGKWHLGTEANPKAGFDYSFSIGPDYPVFHEGTREYFENGKPVVINGYNTQIITDQAVKFLREHRKDVPFFLIVGYTSTHSPWENHPERLVDQFRECNFDDIYRDSTYPFGIQNLESTFITRSNPREALAQYYAAVSQIDEGVGRIMDEINAHDFSTHTLVLYTSDHGLNCGHHGIWGKGNGTLPLNMVEESIRVPLILYYPELIQFPQKRIEFVDHTDLFLTIIDFAGVKLDRQFLETRNYPGTSYFHLLVNDIPLQSWRNFQCCEYGDVRMIRDHRFKLVRRYPDGPNQFFDLHKDPKETVDYYDWPEFQTVISKMNGVMDSFYSKFEDKEKSGLNVKNLPRHNSTESWRDSRNLH